MQQLNAAVEATNLAQRQELLAAQADGAQFANQLAAAAYQGDPTQQAQVYEKSVQELKDFYTKQMADNETRARQEFEQKQEEHTAAISREANARFEAECLRKQ